MNEGKANEEFLPGDEIHDVEGHGLVPSEAPGETEETEDVEGHVQPRRDLDIERI